MTVFAKGGKRSVVGFEGIRDLIPEDCFAMAVQEAILAASMNRYMVQLIEMNCWSSHHVNIKSWRTLMWSLSQKQFFLMTQISWTKWHTKKETQDTSAQSSISFSVLDAQPIQHALDDSIVVRKCERLSVYDPGDNK